MASITLETTIGEILDLDPGTAKFLLGMVMHFLGCPSARSESIADACAVHAVDADELVAQINDYLAGK